jgi:hypothetical protein
MKQYIEDISLSSYPSQSIITLDGLNQNIICGIYRNVIPHIFSQNVRDWDEVPISTVFTKEGSNFGDRLS